VLSESEIEGWASLLDVVPGLALLGVDQGLLVVALDDAEQRVLASAVPIDRIRVEDPVAIHSGGRYGVQLFELRPIGP
jgi:hypothetical protein